MAHIQQRTAKDGATSYRVQIRIKGALVQTATFKRKTDARRWAEQTESAIREGRHFKGRESKRHTLGELIDRYIKTVLPGKPKSQKVQTQQLIWWKDQIGHLLVGDVTPSAIAECRDKLAAGITVRGTRRSAGTTNRYMAALSHAFTIAMREWQWIEDSPMRRVSKPREPRGRVRFLSDDERDRLLTECKASRNSYLYLIVVLALTTGMRRSEILNLKWADIDLQRKRIVIHDTKNNERRSAPVVGHAFNLMQDFSKVRRIDTDLLFPAKDPNDPKKPQDIQSSWKNVIKRAELEDFRFHDLRHSAASYLAMNGATLAEIAAVLGHKTLQMVKRYAHLSDDHTSGVVERMAAQIFPVETKDGRTQSDD